MSGAVLILRPQPGANETAERARARGLEPVIAPLFTIEALEWSPPSPDRFGAILLTSANAVRHGGPGLGPFLNLPCYAVGDSTAAAAGDAGFSDVRTGPSDGAAVAGMMADDGIKTAFHPGAAETMPIAQPGVVIEHVPVYSSVAADRLSDVADSALRSGAVAMLHSPRAAAAFSEHVGDRRERIPIAAISDAAAAAAGTGWAGVGVAMEPRDEALLDAAEELSRVGAHPPPPAPPPLPEAEVPQVPPPPHRPRRRSWLGTLAFSLLIFLLGAAAMVWLLSRWEDAARYAGLAPPPAAAAVPDPVQQSAPSPIAPPTGRAGEGDTIVIDPDVARRVAVLEQQMGEIGTDARVAVDNADRAEGLLVAFAARRALDRGASLGYLEGLLRQRFGQSQPRAVETVIAVSRQPMTYERLREGLAQVGPELTGAAPNQSFWNAVQTELHNLVIVRRVGTPSTDPRERLRRATSRLEAGQVEEALAEVLRMPGRDNARPWIEAAQRYVAARQALDTIEVAALLEPRTPAQPQAAQPQRPIP